MLELVPKLPSVAVQALAGQDPSPTGIRRRTARFAPLPANRAILVRWLQHLAPPVISSHPWLMDFMLGAIHSMVDVAGKTGHGRRSPGHVRDMGRLSC